MKRKGSIYFLVLASAVVIVTVVVGLSLTMMQFRRYTRDNYQSELAEHYAKLGIRHGVYFTTVAPNWREILTSGPWLADVTVESRDVSHDVVVREIIEALAAGPLAVDCETAGRRSAADER